MNWKMIGMSENRVNFVYSLDADQNQGISFEVMASLMFGLGELIQQTNKILNITEGKELKVNILPVKPGSIEIELLLQTTLLAGVFLPQTQNQIKEILSILGLVKDGSDNLISWIRKFGGEKVPETFTQNLDARQSKIGVLYNQPTIIKMVNPVFKGPIYLSGDNGIKTGIKNEPDTFAQITKDDIPYLEAYSNQVSNPNEYITEKEVVLKFKRGSFSGEPDNWSFKLDSDIITATIKDTVFLNDVKLGIKRPSSVDKFKVWLKEIKKVEGDKTSFKYEILKVLDYEIGEKQQELL